MPVTREEYLVHCRQCSLQKFSGKKGVICGLTGEHAAYNEPTCPDFQLDPVRSLKYKEEAQRRAQSAAEEKTMGLSAIGIKNGIVAGIVLISLSIFTFGLLLKARFLPLIIFYGILVVFISGIVVLIKGIIDERKKAKQQSDSDTDDVLDN